MKLAICALLLSVAGCSHQTAKQKPQKYSISTESNKVWSTRDWYIDPANSIGCASDFNTGTSPICVGGCQGSICPSWNGPVSTFNTIIRARMGTFQPVLTQVTTFHQLSPQRIGEDPITFEPYTVDGGQAVLQGTLTSIATLTAVVVTKNKATGSLLQVPNMPTSAAAKMYVCNGARNSCAFIDSMVGSTATMSQPLPLSLINTPTSLPNLVIDDTWASGDALTIYTLPLSNVKVWRPIAGDYTDAGLPSGGWIEWVQIPDSSGLSEYTFVADGFNGIAGCLINTRTHVSYLAGRGNGGYLIGNYHVGQVVTMAGGISELWGADVSGGFQGEPGAGMFVGGDSIMHGAVVVENYLAWQSAYGDGNIIVGGNKGSTLKVTNTLWGSVSISVNPASNVWNNSGLPYTSIFLTSGALSFGSSTTGTSYSAGVWTDGVSLTPAAIDSAGGLQNPRTGARFSFTQ